MCACGWIGALAHMWGVGRVIKRHRGNVGSEPCTVSVVNPCTVRGSVCVWVHGGIGAPVHMWGVGRERKETQR